MKIIKICHVTKQKVAFNSYPHIRLEQIFSHAFFSQNCTFLKQSEIDSEKNGEGGPSQ